mgnify:CR=1 FL=1
MSSGQVDVNDKEKKELLKTLRELIGQFIDGKYNKISLSFEKYLRLTDEEYSDFFGSFFDLESGTLNNLEEYLIETYSSVFEDYEKCVEIIKKLSVTYHYDESLNYVIHSIEGTTVKREINRLLCE